MSGMQGYIAGAALSALFTLYGLRYELLRKQLAALLFDLIIYTILFSLTGAVLGA